MDGSITQCCSRDCHRSEASSDGGAVASSGGVRIELRIRGQPLEKDVARARTGLESLQRNHSTSGSQSPIRYSDTKKGHVSTAP